LCGPKHDMGVNFVKFKWGCCLAPPPPKLRSCRVADYGDVTGKWKANFSPLVLEPGRRVHCPLAFKLLAGIFGESAVGTVQACSITSNGKKKKKQKNKKKGKKNAVFRQRGQNGLRRFFLNVRFFFIPWQNHQLLGVCRLRSSKLYLGPSGPLPERTFRQWMVKLICLTQLHFMTCYALIEKLLWRTLVNFVAISFCIERSWLCVL